MKRILPVIILAILTLKLNAQPERARNIPWFDEKRLHFGFTVGFNATDMSIKRQNFDDPDFLYADMTRISYGFQVSAVSDLRLGDNLNLRFLPGISFGSREVYFYNYDSDGKGDLANLPDADNPVALGPSYLDFPLQLKYRAHRVNNYRPYVIGGVNFRYDMSARKDYDSESKEYVRFKPADFYVEVGFGVDTYLRYFKFAPEIKLAVGLMNLITDEPRPPHPQFVNSIERATAYMILLNFHFE